jgi:hypothetical protein
MMGMEKPTHKIELILNSTGFDGADVQALLPDFNTDRDTVVGLSWYPSAEGPERYYITLSIIAAIGFVSKVFLEELFKDIYTWLKGKILPRMKNKPRSLGSIEIIFQDVRVWGFFEDSSDWLICAESLPKLLGKIDAAESSEWNIELSNGGITILPRKCDSG